MYSFFVEKDKQIYNACNAWGDRMLESPVGAVPSETTPMIRFPIPTLTSVLTMRIFELWCDLKARRSPTNYHANKTGRVQPRNPNAKSPADLFFCFSTSDVREAQNKLSNQHHIVSHSKHGRGRRKTGVMNWLPLELTSYSSLVQLMNWWILWPVQPVTSPDICIILRSVSV